METKGNTEIFAERLFQLRKEYGLSRQQMANELGISRASLEFYEKGQRRPDIEVFAKLAEYFQVSADYLLGISDIPAVQTDIKAVCEFTGLGVDAAVKLHKMCVNHQDQAVLTTIDRLIEHNERIFGRLFFLLAVSLPDEEKDLPKFTGMLQEKLLWLESFDGSGSDFENLEDLCMTTKFQIKEIMERYDLTKNAAFYSMEKEFIELVKSVLYTENYRELRKEFDQTEKDFHEKLCRMSRNYRTLHKK